MIIDCVSILFALKERKGDCRCIYRLGLGAEIAIRLFIKILEGSVGSECVR